MATTRRTSAVGFRHRPTGRNFRKRLGNIQRLRNRLLSLTEGLPCLFRQRRLNLLHGQQVFRREDGVGGLGSRRHGSPVYVCRWSFCSERRLRLNRLHPNGSSGFRPPLARDTFSDGVGLLEQRAKWKSALALFPVSQRGASCFHPPGELFRHSVSAEPAWVEGTGGLQRPRPFAEAPVRRMRVRLIEARHDEQPRSS
jgi:hypothetical protein